MKDQKKAPEQSLGDLAQLRQDIAELEESLAKSKQIEKNAERLRLLFQAVMNEIDQLIFVKDEQYRHIFTNRKTDLAIGRPHSEIIGKTNHELFSKEVADFFSVNDSDVLHQGQGITNEESPDGVHTFLTHKFPITLPDGEILLGGIAIDITGRKQADEKLVM